MKVTQAMKCIALLALTTAAIAAQDPILIRRELKAGAGETYKIQNVLKQFVEIPSMGEQDLIVATTAVVSLKTLSVNSAKGTASIEANTKIEKFHVDGAIAAMMGGNGGDKLPEPKVEKGTLDARNRLLIAVDPKAKPEPAGSSNPLAMMGMGGTANLGAQMLLNLIELPEKPLKVGEELAIGVPGSASMATMGVKDLKMTMKIIGEKEVEGQKLWVVSFSGDLKLDVDSSKMPKQPGQADNPMGDMKMTGTAQISGEGLVDKVTGRTVSNALTITNKALVVLTQMNMEIPTKGTITMKLDLVK
jgi:hypothetical protein